MAPPTQRLALRLDVLSFLVLSAACSPSVPAFSQDPGAGGPGPGATVVNVAVASDIAQAGRTEYARATSRLVWSHEPAVEAVLLGGDNARFGVGASGISLLEYHRRYYAPAEEGDWGRLDDMVFPQSGNHEYGEPDARGYFEYFAGRLGEIATLPSYHGEGGVVGKGWYSFDLNGWHFVSLNSECDAVGGCERGSPQETWLAADLAAHARMPIVAVWHEPRFACGGHSGAESVQDMWADLVAAGADFLFSGHNHYYQRWLPLDDAGDDARVDAAGVTQVIAGSGGVSPYPVCLLGDRRIAGQVGGEGSVGVFFLTIGSDGGYSFEYRRASDGAVIDAGSGKSHHAS